MLRLGIIGKLGLAFISFGAVSLIAAYTIYFQVNQMRSGLSAILEFDTPLVVASYEMEIGTLNAHNVIENYLYLPNQALRLAAEKALLASDHYYPTYLNLVSEGMHSASVSENDPLFTKHIKLSASLINQVTAYQKPHDTLNQGLSRLKANAKNIVRTYDPKYFRASDRLAGAAKFSKVYLEELSETQRLLNSEPVAPVETLNLFEKQADGLTHLLSGYSQNWKPAETPLWLTEMLRESARTPRLARQMVEISNNITSIHNELDQSQARLIALLDHQIETNSVSVLKKNHDSLDKNIRTAIQVLVGWVPVLIIGISGLIFLVARIVVRPVRLLTEAADSIGDGDFTHRVPVMQRDEMGRLARTFNIMADYVQDAYESLKRSNAELDRKVEERTNALGIVNETLNNELILRTQIEQNLIEANRAKTLFLGNMSHELRTPLNAIIGFSDIIKGEMFGPVQNMQYLDYANDIHHSGTHLLNLINELLDISRIEAGEMKLSETAFDLAACVDESVHMHERSAAAKGVILSYEIAGELPFLYGDETRVKQILINLIGNAIKFTPPSGAVTVSAAKLPDGGLQLKVTDTGIGIAPEDIKKVLEPFGQITNDLTRAHEGAGLGLPLARLLAERHQGQLTISSEPGRGTCITVSFPVQRCVENAPAQTRKAV